MGILAEFLKDMETNSGERAGVACGAMAALAQTIVGREGLRAFAGDIISSLLAIVKPESSIIPMAKLNVRCPARLAHAPPCQGNPPCSCHSHALRALNPGMILPPPYLQAVLCLQNLCADVLLKEQLRKAGGWTRMHAYGQSGNARHTGLQSLVP